MSKVAWKPVLATTWNGFCAGPCCDATTAAVALVDSGAGIGLLQQHLGMDARLQPFQELESRS